MSRKISEFFTKKSIKIEQEIKLMQDSEIEKQGSSKIEEHTQNLESNKNSGHNNIQNLTSSNNSGHKNQGKINENVKTEAEKQLLIILPEKNIPNLPVSIKIESNKPKVDNFQCKICQKIFKTRKALERMKRSTIKNFYASFVVRSFQNRAL